MNHEAGRVNRPDAPVVAPSGQVHPSADRADEKAVNPHAAAPATEPRTAAPLADGGRRSPHRLSWSVIRGVRPLTLASDLFACFLAYLLVHPHPVRAIAFALALVALYANSRLYRSRLTLSPLDDLPKIFLGWLSASAVVAAVVSVAGGHLGSAAYPPSVLSLLKSFPIVVFPLIVIGRIIAYSMIRRARASRRVGHQTLIMGAGRVGERLAGILREHPEYGLNPYCFLDDTVDGATEVAGLPVLGGTSDIAKILTDNDIFIVIVAFSHMREHDMVGLIRTCDRMDSELFVVPRLYELHQVEGDMDSVWGVPLIRLRRAAYRSATWPLKRVFDVVCSGLALLVLGIPMLLIALAVRLDGGPGVIFRQDRVGVDGRRVQVMKFRSMRPADEKESQTQWNIAKDNRVTPLGRFLRKTSLDELPQLLNILRGDMSIVGPRPERPHFVSQFQDRYPAYDARHRVPCGLTGLAAVSGLRGDTSIEDRARFDNYYIQNWSLWLDMKIIVRTVSSVVTGAGG